MGIFAISAQIQVKPVIFGHIRGKKLRFCHYLFLVGVTPICYRITSRQTVQHNIHVSILTPACENSVSCILKVSSELMKDHVVQCKQFFFHFQFLYLAHNVPQWNTLYALSSCKRTIQYIKYSFYNISLI